MICENPYVIKGTARAYPCGSCVPCRIRRKLVWKTRITLEATGHHHSSFVTLTYRDDQMPTTPDGLPTLTPTDLKLWLYRFRKVIRPTRIRFYAAGEYSPNERPHYHLVIFGYQGCYYGQSRYRDGRTIDCCSQCDTIRDTWGKGIIETQVFSPEHGGYIAGYVMKKMTSKHDKRLHGRHPEFQRSSNQNGGIGIPALPSLVSTASARINAETATDVPTAVRINGKISPIGRYLRQQIRKALGGDGSAPPEVIEQMEAEMLPLLLRSKTDPENLTLKQQIVALCQGEVASIKARHEIHDSRKRNKSL